MNIWALIGIIAGIAASTGAFIWVALRLGTAGSSAKQAADYSQMAVEEVEHIFNDEFREELRNRGRLHFEKVIGENAMFLQQDLQLTTSQLNEFMKKEITTKLQEEFAKYEESITDAKTLAIESLTKTQEAIDEQRHTMNAQLMQELKLEKDRMLQRFETNMAEIINHYLMAAVGNTIDLDNQLQYILSDLEANKEAITQDLTDGAG